MEQTEPREEAINGPPEAIPASAIRLAGNPTTRANVTPAQHEPCPTCAAAEANTPLSYVYALGKIEPRFPRLSVEKEFAQCTGRAETVNLTDHQALRKVLEENRIWSGSYVG
jgi:hypothetical protein